MTDFVSYPLWFSHVSIRTTWGQWAGAEGRNYQEVMKMFIIDCDDGFMVRAYVKTHQIVYFK